LIALPPALGSCSALSNWTLNSGILCGKLLFPFCVRAVFLSRVPTICSSNFMQSPSPSSVVDSMFRDRLPSKTMATQVLEVVALGTRKSGCRACMAARRWRRAAQRGGKPRVGNELFHKMREGPGDSWGQRQEQPSIDHFWGAPSISNPLL
jgi:hypothetical protein